jgi:hypothetical protein
MESLDAPCERPPQPTRLEMRGYILAILDELHALSVAYELDLAEGLAAARRHGGRLEQ